MHLNIITRSTLEFQNRSLIQYRYSVVNQLTLLVELPDDGLGEVVGLDDVSSARDPDHLSILRSTLGGVSSSDVVFPITSI